ncbi:MAG: helix-turn-helix transcriptional regulator [Bulleidia sp.]
MSENRTITIPLVIARFLLEHSDETHPQSIQDIQKELEDHDLSADRRTIYNAIHALEDTGSPVHCVRRNRKTGYYMEHDFTIEEVFLLNCEMANSPAFSMSDMNTIREKLSRRLSVHQRKAMPHVHIENAEHDVPDLLPAVSILLQAISAGHPVTFRYFDLDPERNRIYRDNTYRMVPYAIACENGRFYCILYSTHHRSFGNYRIDKMNDIVMEDVIEPSVPFSLRDHLRTSFQMYHGSSRTITCRFARSFAPLVYDRFPGTDIIISSLDEHTFTASIRTALTPTLISWIMQFSDRITVIEPQELKIQLYERAVRIYDKYRKELNLYEYENPAAAVHHQ